MEISRKPAPLIAKNVIFLGGDLPNPRSQSFTTLPASSALVNIEGPFPLAHIPDDRMVPPDRNVFIFKTRIKDQWAHALADTGASNNFMSQKLAQFLHLEMHPRKRPLRLLLSKGDYAH